MAGYVIMGTLAAFGALCALWALFGFLLPGARGWTVVSVGVLPRETLWRLKWLKSLGLLACPLIMVAEPGTLESEETEICSPEELLSRLIEERNRFNGTGNGDHPGCHQRRGISEL